MLVQLFIPCFIDQIQPKLGEKVYHLLQKAGCEVIYNPSQTCCGQPPFNAGYWDDAKLVATKFINDITLDIPLVVPSSSCTGMVKNYYSDLFNNTVAHNTCRSLQGRTFELSDFLVNKLSFIDFDAEFTAKAVYHDSCSALRECKLYEEPRLLLSKVKGLELIETSSDFEACCGFGGTFSVKFPEISSSMAEQKINQALDFGANYIISSDASCLIHMQTYIDKQCLPIKTIHLAEVLMCGA